MKGLCDVAQLFESFYVVLDYSYLLLGVLRQIVHLAYLHNQVFLCLGVRQRVEAVECLRDAQCGECRLAVEWHLQLYACRRVVLQCLCDIVGLAVCAAVGHRYGRGEVVVKSRADVYLRQKSGAVFTDVVLAFKHIALVSLQVEVSLDAHLQTPPQRQRLLRH